MSGKVFLLHRQSCCQVYSSNKLNQFSSTLRFVFAKTFQAERAEPTCGEKQSKSATVQQACVKKSSDWPSEAFLHRDLAPVQIDLAAACTDSVKLSRKCEYPP